MTAVCLTINVSEGGSPPSGESIFEIVDFEVLSQSVVAGQEMSVQVDVKNTSGTAGEAVIRFRQGTTGVILGVTDPVEVPANSTIRVEIALDVPAAIASGPLQICTTATDVATASISNALCVTVQVGNGSSESVATSIPWWVLAAAGLVVVGVVVTRK
jgi:hypothetical protein